MDRPSGPFREISFALATFGHGDQARTSLDEERTSPNPQAGIMRSLLWEACCPSPERRGIGES
eukprot:11803791-Alexandrium_andersonii.AAC.1